MAMAALHLCRSNVEEDSSSSTGASISLYFKNCKIMSLPYRVDNVRNTGITVLFEPNSPAVPIVDIVFVHGLQGHPRNTWTWEPGMSSSSNNIPIESPQKKNRFGFWKKGKKTGDGLADASESQARSAVFWPYHLLPTDCPDSRIITWGYDSKVSHFFDGSANKNNIHSHSRDLLGDLSRQRGLCLERPIIFVSHSLGGIVVKQMLLDASRSDEKSYEDLFRSAKAVFFLGTPHSGSSFADLGDILAKIVAAMGMDASHQNLATLKPNSALLEKCRKDFHMLYNQGKFEVYTFQEAKGIKGTSFAGLNDKVVPDVSSEFLGSERCFSIDANHRMMCRYSSKEDDGYRKVGRELETLCQKILDVSKHKNNEKISGTVDDGLQLSTQRSEYLDLLAFQEMNYREQEVRDAHANSCDWLLEHPSYTGWIGGRRGLLGIRGKPGSGKSTLMKKIFRLLNEQKDEGQIQLVFFFHRRGTALQHTQTGMFRSLLYQLLNQVSSVQHGFIDLCNHKKRWVSDPGTSWEWRLEELRETFSAALIEAAKTYAITMFLDALDEAGDEAAREVVAYLYELDVKLQNQEVCTAICFSCRYFPVLAVNSGFEIRVDDYNKGDISSYTLAELKRQLLLDDEVINHSSALESLRTDIVSRASGVFMWVALVVPLVTKQHNDGMSLEAIRQTLTAVPSQLEEVYKHIFTRVVNPEHHPDTLHMMQWIYLAKRPLSVTQLRLAMGSDDSSILPAQYSCKESKGFVESDARMKKLINSLSGGLAEVKLHTRTAGNQQDTVQFIHQSVNDFLQKDRFKCLQLTSTEDLIGMGHHRLCRSCINYLRLGETKKESEALDNSKNFPPSEAGIERAVLSTRLPFLAYAAVSWVFHAEMAERHNLSQKDLLLRFNWPSIEFFQIWDRVHRLVLQYESGIHTPGANLLHIAAQANLVTTIEALLENGANVENKDAEGYRPIHRAARNGHENILYILVDAHAEIDAEATDGETAVGIAAGLGHETMVRFLLERYSISSTRMAHLNDALYAAAESGKETLVWYLIKQGAEVNAQGGEYGNALQAAAFMGHKTVVEMLLVKGAEVNAQGGDYGNALQAAAFDSSKTVVEMLLDKGAEVNAQGGKYGNALQAAAFDGNKTIVEILLDKGAEVNAQGGDYGNALRAARENNKKEIEQILLEHGAEDETETDSKPELTDDIKSE